MGVSAQRVAHCSKVPLKAHASVEVMSVLVAKSESTRWLKVARVCVPAGVTHTVYMSAHNA